jgi:hypothetical protein
MAQIILSKLQAGFDGLGLLVNEFLHWDINSMAFAKHRAIKMNSVLNPLKTAASRATGFSGQDDPDTLDEHWIHNAEGGASLQAIHCAECGNYVFSNTLAFVNWEDDDNIDTFREKCLQSNFKHIICLCPHQQI